MTYGSSDSAVATVDNNGKVTIVGLGSAVIAATEATSTNFAGQTAMYTVTVTQAGSGSAGYIVLNAGANMTKKFGDAAFTQAATGGNGGTVTYGSSDSAVATVDNNGKVTIVGLGSAVITATEATSTFAGQTATYTVTVTQAGSGSAGYTVLNAGANMTKKFGDAAFTQAATGGNGGTVTYGSSDSAVATVDNNGKVTIVGLGSAVITATEATSTNFAGQTATYTVTVTQAGSGSAGYTALDAGADMSRDINERFTQAATGGNGGAVTYGSDNTAVATVDNNGKVTIVGPGSAVITATEAASTNFAAQSDSYRIYVTRAIYSSSLGISFMEPVSSKMGPYDANDFCTGSGGPGSVRLPTDSEFSQLYSEMGDVGVYGWPTDSYYWGKRGSSYYVSDIDDGSSFKLSNGIVGEENYYVSCIKKD
ncbi:hypothetical protein FQP88_20325 [Vibrio atlanticus]|nr:hypothetical protein FQP88_20325 [Vibrio atlanticus]